MPLNLFLIIKSTIIITKLNLLIIIKLKIKNINFKNENNFLKSENKPNHTFCVKILAKTFGRKISLLQYLQH